MKNRADEGKPRLPLISFASVHDSCEGRQVFTISDDGKTLTYDSHTKRFFRASVDGRTYEAEDTQDMHTVLVKKRRP